MGGGRREEAAFLILKDPKGAARSMRSARCIYSIKALHFAYRTGRGTHFNDVSPPLLLLPNATTEQ